MADILKKFDFFNVKTASTPMAPNKALFKDVEAEDVDVHLYRLMIGSLIYLTASRPDITFLVCACARDSPFDLEACSDSDYARTSLDMKSTTRGCQFLSKRLISWQCKKKTIVANSTTEAEYVAAVNCCGQVTKISQSSGPTNLVADKTIYKEWEDRMERAATTTSSLEAEPIHKPIHASTPMAPNKALFKDVEAEDVDVHLYRLMIGLLIYLTASRPDITFLVCACASKRFISCQCKKKTIVATSTTEAEYVAAVNCCGQVTKISQSSGPTNLLADKTIYKEWEDRMERAATTTSSLEAEPIHEPIHGGISSWKTLMGEGSTVSAESHHTPLGDPIFSQPPLSSPSRVPTSPYDSPISRGHTPGSDEGSLTLNELTVLFTPIKVSSQEDQPEDQLGVMSAAKILADATRVYTYSKRRRAVSTGKGGVSTSSRIISIAEEIVSTAGVSIPVSTAGMVQESTYLPRATKDKGKAIMTESEPEQTTTKEEHEHLSKRRGINVENNQKKNHKTNYGVTTPQELRHNQIKEEISHRYSYDTILLDLPEDIYASVDSYETAQEIWLRVQQMMKGSDIGIQEKKAKLFNEWESCETAQEIWLRVQQMMKGSDIGIQEKKAKFFQ
nr:uncharacterized mitochondrial protein AtMg00810-like [Tanacetum cinerariifolium]